MKLTPSIVPYSGVVGSSISLSDETGKCVALLVILVPNPDLDYKTTAEEVGKAVVGALKAHSHPHTTRTDT